MSKQSSEWEATPTSGTIYTCFGSILKVFLNMDLSAQISASHLSYVARNTNAYKFIVYTSPIILSLYTKKIMKKITKKIMKKSDSFLILYSL